MGRLAGPIEILDELQQPAFVVKRFAVAGAIVFERDARAAVEKREFLQAAVEDVVFELRRCRTLADRA